MESMQSLLGVLTEYGPYGLLIFMWWNDMRAIRAQQTQHAKEMQTMMDRYAGDMSEMRQMYQNNVELVKTSNKLAEDLKDVVMINTQAFQRLDDAVEGNRFCPMVRLEKQAHGAQT